MKIVGGKWSNWSGNVVFKPRATIAPQDEVDLAVAVRKTEGHVRFPGNGHSFAPLNQTDGTLIDLSAFTGLKGFDPEREVASIAAATPLWGLGSLLHPLGYALNNMADIDRQTLGGAVATGTHGSGLSLPSLSADVASFRLLLTTGEVIHCSPDENPEIFAAGRLSLGLLGVMTEIDMKVRPVYKLQRKFFQHPVSELFRQLDGLAGANRSFSFFWFPNSDKAVCRSLNETECHAPVRHSARTLEARGERRRADEYVFLAAAEALRFMPALMTPAHRFFTAFMSKRQKVRWSHEVYPAARTVRHTAMEYAFPFEKGADVVQELAEAVRKAKINTAFPIVYRTVAADDVWLSPFYGRPSATVTVHQYIKCDSGRLFKLAEEIFRSHGGRPHWGKIHTASRDELAGLYPKYEEFCALRRKLDPKDKFFNDHLAPLFR
jgi:FAD-linked oxidoreductase